MITGVIVHLEGQALTCPTCNSPADGFTAADRSTYPPSPGDLNVCAYCASANRYTAELRLEALGDADIAALPVEDRMSIAAVRTVVAEVIRRGGPRQ